MLDRHTILKITQKGNYMIHIADMLKHAQDRIVFKKETLPDGRTVTIAFYQHLTTNEWSKGLEDPNFFEFRGIVFDEQGKCICRPFEKFFNVGQVPWCSFKAIPDDQKIEIQDKKDGALVNPVKLLDGRIMLKTKKSFYSETANDANAALTPEVRALSEYLIDKGLTPNFEFISPRWKVVVNYGNVTKFVLLAIRDIDSGEYLSNAQCAEICNQFNVEFDSPIQMTKAELLLNAKSQKEIEGYILNVAGHRSKLKTDWYMERHYYDTDLRYRDVADAVVAETIDDLMSSSKIENEHPELRAKVEEIEEKVLKELSLLRQTALTLKQKYDTPEKNFAAIAQDLKNEPVRAIVLRLLRGATPEEVEPMLVKVWQSSYRQNYPLTAIINDSF